MKNAHDQPTAGQNRVRRIPSVAGASLVPRRANSRITAISTASPTSRLSPSTTPGSSAAEGEDEAERGGLAADEAEHDRRDRDRGRQRASL